MSIYKPFWSSYNEVICCGYCDEPFKEVFDVEPAEFIRCDSCDERANRKTLVRLSKKYMTPKLRRWIAICKVLGITSSDRSTSPLLWNEYGQKLDTLFPGCTSMWDLHPNWPFFYAKVEFRGWISDCLPYLVVHKTNADGVVQQVHDYRNEASIRTYSAIVAEWSQEAERWVVFR